ncbi:hypothetical protein GCM10008932_11930 [Alkalibacterium iburiense]|uniref:Uncharacterized protein n=1 Tax=Alkalibacterium iburiense TaxID=290589 RepID=A0ABP3H2T1_9LACT
MQDTGAQTSLKDTSGNLHKKRTMTEFICKGNPCKVKKALFKAFLFFIIQLTHTFKSILSVLGAFFL